MIATSYPFVTAAQAAWTEAIDAAERQVAEQYGLTRRRWTPWPRAGRGNRGGRSGRRADRVARIGGDK